MKRSMGESEIWWKGNRILVAKWLKGGKVRWPVIKEETEWKLYVDFVYMMPNPDNPFQGRGAVKVVAICDLVSHIVKLSFLTLIYPDNLCINIHIVFSSTSSLNFMFLFFKDIGSNAPLLLQCKMDHARRAISRWSVQRSYHGRIR